MGRGRHAGLRPGAPLLRNFLKKQPSQDSATAVMRTYPGEMETEVHAEAVHKRSPDWEEPQTESRRGPSQGNG